MSGEGGNMKEEGKKERRDKKNSKKDDKKEEKKDKVKPVKKISTVSVPPKTSHRLSDMMSAEGFRSTSLLVTLTLIMVLSTTLLVLVTILIGSFRIPLLTMASANFFAGPVLMAIGSCLGILLAIAGFVLVFKRHFNLYIGLAACSLLVFLFQIVAVILAFLLRDNIDSDFNKVNVESELEQAAGDPTRMEVWDAIQVAWAPCTPLVLSSSAGSLPVLWGPR